MINSIKSKRILYGIITINILFYVITVVFYNIRGFYMSDIFSFIYYLIFGTILSSIILGFLIQKYRKKGIELAVMKTNIILSQIPVTILFILTILDIFLSRMLID